MRPIVLAGLAVLALSFSAPCIAADNQNQAPANPGSKEGNAKAKAANPTAHIYRKGDRLSLAFGSPEEVADWKQHNLTNPSTGDHWMYYDDNYLLVQIGSGVIMDIVKASWDAGRS
jgi:Ni/Co efflux regulator RcnB